jgi:hypothetical protein
VTEVQKAEATDGVIAVEWEGHTYEVVLANVTIDALEAFEDGRIVGALRSILGVEQWAAYKERHPQALGLGAFVDALLAAVGGAGGNS